MSISRKIVGYIDEDQGSALQKIGSYSDTEQISKLLDRRFAVCRIVLANGQGGTGFLIGKNLILTNNHVLDSKETALKAKVVFFHTTKSKGVEVYLDPNNFFYTSLTPDQLGFKCITANDMDFTIVSIHSHPKIAEIEYLAFCIFYSQIPSKESHANIIHHPLEENGTHYQKVSFRDNVLKNVELFSIHYTTSTMPGSSGSPVMNDEGELIALHRATCTEILKALLEKKVLDALLRELFPGVTFTEKTATFSGPHGTPKSYPARYAVIDGSSLYVFYKEELKGQYFHEEKMTSPASLFKLIAAVGHQHAREWALQFLIQQGVAISDYHQDCNTAVPIQAICSHLQKAGHLEPIKKRYEACQKNVHTLSKSFGEAQVTVSTLLQKVLDLLEEQAIQQDKEISRILEAKAGILINLNSNQDLTTSEQEFLRWTAQLLDTKGKVRGFVRNKLAQPQSSSISEPNPPTQSNIIYPMVSSTKPHLSNPYPISTTTNDSKPLTINNSSIIQAPQLNPISIATSPTSLLALPSCAFGAAQWKKYFGDVGVEPPLPKDIDQILQGPCPIWPGKTVEQTHMFVLIPATINGQPFTLKKLGELVQSPKTGPATEYSSFELGQYQDNPVPQPYWFLMSQDVLEDSLNKNYKTQFEQVATLAKKTGIPYNVPTVLEAATCVFMHHASTGQKRYGDRPWTYTRCQEFYNKEQGWKLIVGCFAAGGLDVHGDGYGYEDSGVGAGRKFLGH